MGSSIRSYLWLRCGVFHQIPTLAGVLTLSGEWYRGSALSPFVLFVAVAGLPPCIFALCRRGPSWEHVFVYCLLVLLSCMWSFRCLCVFSVSTSLSSCWRHHLCAVCTFMHSYRTLHTWTCIPRLGVCVWPAETLWPRQHGVACWHRVMAGELPPPQLMESKQANQSQRRDPLWTPQPFGQPDDGRAAAEML